MLLLDVNVVLAAHRGDHAHHAAVRPWFEGLLAGDQEFTVPVPVWTSFLRLATNRRIFEVPTPRPEAFEFIAATSEQPHHLSTAPGPRHLDLVRRLCDEGDATGNLVQDAVIAAIALEYRCTVVTMDRDFARFPSVAHRRPPDD